MSRPSVELRGVTKAFAGTTVLRDVDLALHPGAIHSLVGANGSGKSTLIKVLAGVYGMDGGEVLVDGAPPESTTPEGMAQSGLRFIHQDPGLFGELSVVDNISIGARFHKSRVLVDARAERRAAKAALAAVGAAIDSSALVADLAPAQRTMVAVARAIQPIENVAPPRLLVLDEPTAALSDAESQKLFDVLHRVRANGLAILYVSHRLQEVIELSDEVTILRDGARIAHLQRDEFDERDLVSFITAREVQARAREARVRDEAAPALRVAGLSGSHWDDVSFDVAPGEIVGVAGLLGSGRSELLETIAGLKPATAGSVRLDDRDVPLGDPSACARLGITITAENRLEGGAFPELTVQENLTLGLRARPRRRLGVLRPAAERREAQQLIAQYDIRPADPDRAFWMLSGGNQQKVVLARAVRERPRIVLLDEPTQAVDVGAKADIHRLMSEIAATGAVVMIVSSDFTELLAVSDRILVLRGRRLVSDRPADAWSEEDLVHAAALQSAPIPNE